MVRRVVPSLCWIAAALALGGLAPSAVAGSGFGVVVFGDSLSDPGNHFAAFGRTSEAPFEAIPSDPYGIRGHRFSNGPTWIEQLAARLRVPLSAGPALRAPRLCSNYAVGGARAQDAADFAYDLGEQVSRFLADREGAASAHALYVVWIGGNDVRDALGALLQGAALADVQTQLEAAVQAVATQLRRLHTRGAREFLIVNVPDLAPAPAVAAIGPQVQELASLLSETYDAALALAVGELRGALADARLTELDAAAVLSAVLEAPLRFGLVEVERACLSAGAEQDAACARPHGYLYWDGIHPTTAAHGILARAGLRALRAR